MTVFTGIVWGAMHGFTNSTSKVYHAIRTHKKKRKDIGQPYVLKDYVRETWDGIQYVEISTLGMGFNGGLYFAVLPISIPTHLIVNFVKRRRKKRELEKVLEERRLIEERGKIDDDGLSDASEDDVTKDAKYAEYTEYAEEDVNHNDCDDGNDEYDEEHEREKVDIELMRRVRNIINTHEQTPERYAVAKRDTVEMYALMTGGMYNEKN